jgi:hypothetical protein
LRHEKEAKLVQSSRDLGGGRGEILVSEIKRMLGDWSLINLLGVRTAVGQASPCSSKIRIDDIDAKFKKRFAKF